MEKIGFDFYINNKTNLRVNMTGIAVIMEVTGSVVVMEMTGSTVVMHMWNTLIHQTNTIMIRECQRVEHAA